MTLMRFGASWCAPCRALRCLLDKIMEDSQGIDYVYIDVDDADNTDIVTQYNIKSIPTLIIVEDGEEKRRMTGATSENKLRQFIDNGELPSE